jgi:hypothetical protein
VNITSKPFRQRSQPPLQNPAQEVLESLRATDSKGGRVMDRKAKGARAERRAAAASERQAASTATIRWDTAGRARRASSLADEPQVRPVPDPRLAGLLLGTLDQLSAVVGSALSGVPYAAIRKVAGFSSGDENELRESLERVAQTSTSFAEHRPLIELLVGVTALHAAKADHLLMLTDKQKPLSLQEMFGMLLLIFSPLLLLGLIFLLKSQRRTNE